MKLELDNETGNRGSYANINLPSTLEKNNLYFSSMQVPHVSHELPLFPIIKLPLISFPCSQI